MNLREAAEKLSGVVAKVAKLGIEPKPVPRHLIEPMAWEEVHPMVLKERFDRRDFLTGPDGLIYLADSEENEGMITRKYAHFLSQVGATPIVRKKTLNNGTQVIDLPLLVAQRQIASSIELRKQVPKLYGDQPTEKGEPDYLKMGLGPQEIRAGFALDRLPSLHEQKRLKNSETFSGRARNVEEDAIKVIGEKASATGQRLGSSAKRTLEQAPLAGLNLAKTALTAIKETPKTARDTVQLGIISFAIGEAVTENLVEPVLNQAFFDAKDTVIAVKDKVASLPKTPTDIISAFVITQIKNTKLSKP